MKRLRYRLIEFRFFVGFLALAAVAWLPLNASAQPSSEMTEVYGRGVHAYFGGQSDDAEAQFTQVIDAGSRDPRVFYFRAMSRIRAGRQQEAASDMRIGAAHEAVDPGIGSEVSRALSRIQ